MARKPARKANTRKPEAKPATSEDALRPAMREASAAIRRFVEYANTLDRDAAGNAHSPHPRPTLERKWGEVCEAANAVRRIIVSRQPTETNAAGGKWRVMNRMSASDQEVWDVLSQSLFESALTRYTSDGTEYVTAMKRELNPLVARTVVEPDRLRKLTATASLLDKWAGSAEGGSDFEYRPAAWFGKRLAARLRMAARKDRKSKRVRKRTIDRVVCYSVADARQWWPSDVPKEP